MKNKRLIAGILIVALVAVCAFSLFIAVKGIDTFRNEGVNIRLFSMDVVSAEAEEETRLEVSAPANLVVDADYGDVIIVGGAEGQVIVTAHKKAWNRTQAEAEADLEMLDYQVIQDGNAIRLTFKMNEINMLAGVARSDLINFEIKVPEDTSVKVETGLGDISLKDTRGNVDLYSGFGDLVVSGVAGSVKVGTNSGMVQLVDVDAKREAIDMDSDFGDLSLTNVTTGDLSVSSNSGKITLTDTNCSGAVDLSTGYGDISFESGQAASLKAKSSSGVIALSALTVNGSLTVESSYGDLRLEQALAASYDLDTSSGVITVTGAKGKLRANSGYGNIKVTEAIDTDIDLDTSSGEIVFSGSLGAGPHTIHSDYGLIHLTIPADLQLTFDMKTEYGKVRSELPVTVQGGLDDEHLTGTVNGGGASLTVTTSSGDIRIETLNP